MRRGGHIFPKSIETWVRSNSTVVSLSIPDEKANTQKTHKKRKKRKEKTQAPLLAQICPRPPRSWQGPRDGQRTAREGGAANQRECGLNVNQYYFPMAHSGCRSATITSLRASRACGTGKSMSLTHMLTVTLAPPSRQIRAAALSTANPRPPNSSSGTRRPMAKRRPHRHVRTERGKGRRRRSTRNQFE